MKEKNDGQYRRYGWYVVTTLLIPLLLEIGYAIIHFYSSHRVAAMRSTPPAKTMDAGHYESTFTNDDGTCEMFDSAGRTRPFGFYLKDGTWVRLGFCSSLRYPCDLRGGNRYLLLNGQAEFKVAHNRDQPMIVRTSRFVIQVLGTHFNVVDFGDDSSCELTLLSGKVNVTHNKETLPLRPYQQVAIREQNMILRTPQYPERCLAWAGDDACLDFDSTDLTTVLLRLARWYDVKVINQKGVKGVPVIGTFSLLAPLDTNLRRLGTTQTGYDELSRKHDSVFVK